MSFVAPSPAEFKARYPEFDGLINTRVQSVLDEVALDVGDDWPEVFRFPAMLALTGHLLAQEGALRGNQTAGASVESAVTSVSVGDVKTSFSGSGATASGATSAYASTAYGRRFIELKLLAFGNPRPSWDWL
jgi:hypothetical protein